MLKVKKIPTRTCLAASVAGYASYLIGDGSEYSPYFIWIIIASVIWLGYFSTGKVALRILSVVILISLCATCYSFGSRSYSEKAKAMLLGRWPNLRGEYLLSEKCIPFQDRCDFVYEIRKTRVLYSVIRLHTFQERHIEK